MKIYSLPGSSNLGPGSQVKADVVASENGRSLVMLNGVPVAAEGEFPAGHSLAGHLAATDGGFSIIVSDNATGVSAEKLLQNAGIHESTAELASALKEFGVPVTPQNLETAAQLLAGLPSGTADKINVQLVAIMLLRRLDGSAIDHLRSYLKGELNFARLFSGLNSDVLQNLRQSWGEGKLILLLQQLLAKKVPDIKSETAVFEKMVDGLTENLQLQHILSTSHDYGDEARLYFQWPMFWDGQDLPDTLEGEAFVPARKEGEGFSLRIMINPPALGKMEVSMHELKRNLWVHFAVAETSLDIVVSMFDNLREALVRQGFASVRLTLGQNRLLDNFFAHAEPPEKIDKAPIIDLRV